MKRILIAALALLASTAAPHAQTVLRFSTAAPPSDFLNRALTAFKDELARTVPTEVTVNTYPGGTLFRQGTEIPALQRGTLEMSTGTTFEVAQQLPELGFFNRGYLIRDYAHLRRIFDGPVGQEYRRRVAEKMGIEILAVGYLGTRQVNLRAKREVRGPTDLSGVRMRMPGDPEWLLLGQAIGVSPVPMGMPEVYLALKTGTIDGQENPLTILNAAKFYEVTEQIVMTSHLVQPVFFDISARAWGKLSDETKAKLRTAAASALQGNDQQRLADEKTVVDSLRQRGLTVTEPDLAPFRQRAEEVYAASPVSKAWDAALMRQAME